jgi:hypothetical protein
LYVLLEPVAVYSASYRELSQHVCQCLLASKHITPHQLLPATNLSAGEALTHSRNAATNRLPHISKLLLQPKPDLDAVTRTQCRCSAWEACCHAAWHRAYASRLLGWVIISPDLLDGVGLHKHALSSACTPGAACCCCCCCMALSLLLLCQAWVLGVEVDVLACDAFVHV